MDPINCLKQGNTEAFRQTFLNLHGAVYAYLLTKSKDKCVAQEITQITFIKLWEYRHTLSGDHSVETQVFRIARTCFIDQLRSKARRRGLLTAFMTCAPPPYGYMDLPDQQQHVSTVLEALPPVRRKVFILSRMGGLSYREIALQMDISDRTVEKHISMAIKQLKKIMFFLSVIAALFH